MVVFKTLCKWYFKLKEKCEMIFSALNHELICYQISALITSYHWYKWYLYQKNIHLICSSILPKLSKKLKEFHSALTNLNEIKPNRDDI